MFFDSMNIAIMIGAALVVVAVFTSLLSYRFGAPLLLVFLALGLVAGEDGLGITFDNADAAYFIGSVALAIILFDSGFATRLGTLRTAAGPAAVLATVGVLLTAFIVSLAAMPLFGLTWIEAILIGAIVAPTDAAAVFFLLRVGGISIRERVRATLEVESASNDPIAIFLTISVAAFLAAGGASEGGLTAALVRDFVLQAGVGTVFGIAGGLLIVQVLRRTSFEAALYPIIVIALALVLFAATAMSFGSGFLAVFLAGIIVGNSRVRPAATLRRFQEGTTWLAQIAMFLTLGLLASPSEFGNVLVPALALAFFLTFIARPLAIWVCLVPFGFSRQETAFIAWVGLRGATSVLLAIVPILYLLPNAQTLFNATFIVVLASLLVQGWTIGPLARLLKLIVPPRVGPVERLELELPGTGQHEMAVYVVHPDSPVANGHRIPRWARPALIVREGRTLRPHRYGKPQAGDRLYVITTPEYVPLLDGLFAGRVAEAEDPAIYGEFGFTPDTRLADLAQNYPVPIAAGDEGLTVGDLLRRELSGDIEAGDRIAYGAVDLIVRRVSDSHEIEEVGLAMEQARSAAPNIPLFQSPREIAGMIGAWFRRKRN